MPHPRWLTLAVLALAALAPVAGCLTSGQNGDPGAAFSSGGNSQGASGHAGSSAAGFGGTRGSAGSSAAGASGAGGARDGGTTSDGAADAPKADTGVATDAPGAADADAGGTKPAACTVGATATFTVAWSLEDATGAVSTCDGVGGKTVDVDVVSLTTGAESLSTTPCAALTATTCAMPAGNYSISMKLRDAAGNALTEIFAPTLILAEGQATGVTSLPFQVGGADATRGRGFALTWSIDKVGTGAIQTCAQTGAATVRVLAGTTKFDLTCADGKGRTTGLTTGSYPVTLDLLDAAGAKLSETQTMNVAVGVNQLVFLGDVPFDVN